MTLEHRLPLGYRNILKTHVLSQSPPPQQKNVKLTRFLSLQKRLKATEYNRAAQISHPILLKYQLLWYVLR